MTVLTAVERDRLWGRRCEIPTAVVSTPWQGDRVRIHHLLAPLFLEACVAAFRDDHAGFAPRRIDSYACRNVRGSTSPSLHSWALAVDLFATDEGVPPPGGVWCPDDTVTPGFARHFTQRGFRWGRWFSRQDWPHLEFPGPPPGPSSTIVDPEEARVALNQPASSIVLSPTGEGYWIVAQDGGIFAFGDAVPFGDNALPSQRLNAPVIDAERTPTGQGLYLLGADGGVFTFGDAKFRGSAAG